MKNGKLASDRLTQFSDGGEVMKHLTRSGFDVSRVVRDQVGRVDTTGVLLVGSVAEGFQNQASDVDLLFLTHDRRPTTPKSLDLFLEAGPSLESLVYHDGIEINTEVIYVDAYRSLAEVFRREVELLTAGTPFQPAAFFDDFGLRLLHRLRTGITVAGPDVVDSFRRHFGVDALPHYLAVMHLARAADLLEEAAASDYDTPGLVEYICHQATQNCLLALAAARGFTSQTHRHLMSWIEESTGHADRNDLLLRELQHSLLEHRPVPADRKRELVDAGDQQFRRTRDLVREVPTARDAVDRVSVARGGP